jgi:hypothetical protein
VPKCLVCNAESVGHRYAQVASMPCNEENKPAVMALFYHVKNHEWESLKDFREFRADQDDAIAYAVTGPHEGGMVVLIRDRVESNCMPPSRSTWRRRSRLRRSAGSRVSYLRMSERICDERAWSNHSRIAPAVSGAKQQGGGAALAVEPVRRISELPATSKARRKRRCFASADR